MLLKNAYTGLPRSIQVTRLGRSRHFAGDTRVSVSTPSKWITDHMPFWQSPILQVAFGSFNFTTFISGSLALTIQPSLAPHPGATPEITPEPLTGFDVPRKVATLSERLVPHRCQ